MRPTVCPLASFIALLASASMTLADHPGDSAAVGDSQIGHRRDIRLPDEPYDYARTALPDHVSSLAAHYDNTPGDNPITNDGATLGRVLFYDTMLSANQSTSCASCHLQKLAFTDGKPKSIGFQGRKVSRNSMSLINLRYYRQDRFFWDERAKTLEAQVLMPIENPVEMGHDVEDLIGQLQSDPLYPPLFGAAFGDSRITKDRIAKALAQFVRSIVSFASRYDIGRSQVESVLDPFPNFTDQENLGKEQFFGRARCAACHLPDDESRTSQQDRQSAFFHLARPTVNGIDSNAPGEDQGVGELTHRREDQGKFKASSLRNVELTAPYMHDGRFRTLDAVVEHYNWSVRPHENLDPILEGFTSGLALPEVEKVALTQFLCTLTDHALTSAPKFADPFSQD